MSSPGQDKTSFFHDIGELVLVKWNDGMVYFAKIRRIDYRKRKCIVVFDDRSTDEADFSQIHSVDETTTDIICIKCKKDDSESPNEIVLCDSCGIGFHQKCHSPPIPAVALELDNPWHCVYCQRKLKNPYLTESIDVMQTLFADDENKPAMVTIKQEVPDNYEEDEMLTSQDDESIVTTESEIDEGHGESNRAKSPVHKRRKGKRGGGQISSYRKSLSKMRPLEAFRHKMTRLNFHLTSKAPRNEATILPSREQRRGRDAFAGFKRRRPSTVEAHTVSVQQVSPAAMNEDHDKGPVLLPKDLKMSPPITSGADELQMSPVVASGKNNFSIDAAEVATSDGESSSAKRPRSLRVSLTLPPSVEASPKPSSNSSRSVSPKAVDLPSWTTFSSNALDVGYPIRTLASSASSLPFSSALTGNNVLVDATEEVVKDSSVVMDDSKSSLQDDVFEGEDPQRMEIENEQVLSVPAASPPPKLTESQCQPRHGAGPGVVPAQKTQDISSFAIRPLATDPPHRPLSESAAASEVKEVATVALPVKAKVIQTSAPVRISGVSASSHKKESNLPAKTSTTVPVWPSPAAQSSSIAVASKATVPACTVNSTSGHSHSGTTTHSSGANCGQQVEKQGSKVQSPDLHTQLPAPAEQFQELTSHPQSGTRPVRIASGPVYQPQVHVGEQPSNPPPLGSQDTLPFSKDIIMATRPKRILHAKTVDIPTGDPEEDETQTAARLKHSTGDASIPGAVIVPQPARPIPCNHMSQKNSAVATTMISATGEVASVYTLSSESHLGGAPGAAVCYSSSSSYPAACRDSRPVVVHRAREPRPSPAAADSPVQHVMHDKTHLPLIPVSRPALVQPPSNKMSPVVPMQAVTISSTHPVQQQNMVTYYVMDSLPAEEQTMVSAAVTPGYMISHIPSALEPAAIRVVPAPVNTTKPYAVVNAIPTHSAGQLSSPTGAIQQYSFPMKPGPLSGSSTPVQPIQSPNTFSHLSKPPAYPSGHHRGGSTTANSSSHSSSQGSRTHPIVIGSAEKSCQKPVQENDYNGSMREEATTELADHLRMLSRKFGREFNNLNEEKLIDIFHDALKKFQRNGKKYELYTRKSFTMQRQTHPNFEVMPSHPPPLAPVCPSQPSTAPPYNQPHLATHPAQPPHSHMPQPPQQQQPSLQPLAIPRPPPLSSTQQVPPATATSPQYLPFQTRPMSLKSRAIHLTQQGHHLHSVVSAPTAAAPISPAPAPTPPSSYVATTPSSYVATTPSSYMATTPQGMNVVYVPTHQAVPSLQATSKYQSPQQIVFQTAAMPSKVPSASGVLAGTPVNAVGGTPVSVLGGGPTLNMGRTPVKMVSGTPVSVFPGGHSNLMTLTPMSAEPSSHVSQLTPGHAPPTRSSYQVQTTGLFVPPPSNDIQLQNKAAMISQAASLRPQVLATHHPQATSHQSLSESSTGTPVIVQRPIVAPTEMEILASQKRVVPPPSSSSVLEVQGGSSSSRRKVSKITRQCARCCKDATYLCSGCHQEWYCGRECQLKAWDQHAEHCKS